MVSRPAGHLGACMSNEQGPLTFWNDLLSQCGNPQGDRQAHLVCPQRIPAAAAGLSSQPPTPQACLHSWPWASSPSLKPQKARTRVASSLSHPGSIFYNFPIYTPPLYNSIGCVSVLSSCTTCRHNYFHRNMT